MRRALKVLTPCLLALAALGAASVALADPSDRPGEIGHSETGGVFVGTPLANPVAGIGGTNSRGEAPELEAFEGRESQALRFTGNSDKDGPVNSDLAFYGDLAFAGNYDGFRILDIDDPRRPRVLTDYFCRGPQNDVSVYRLRNRLLLFQSIDTPQTQDECDGTPAGSSQDTPLTPTGQREFGFEGIRVFDVTRPTRPRYLTAVPTACGSHTHTVIPDERRDRVLLYVSSYPLGSGITPSDSQAPAGLRCQSPHQKISIVEVRERDPEDARLLREEPLSSDTTPYPGAGGPLAPPFIACHDIQAFLKKETAVAACAGDGQIWDISNPANPSASDGEEHTHIRSPSGGDRFEFIHSGVVTWDGRYFAIMDETGGGVTAECDGSAPEGDPPGATTDGFYYFYRMVEPGDPAPALESRYSIPRPQGAQICVSHNANVIPTDDGYYMVAAYYEGGNTVVDFSDVEEPREIAFSDPRDQTGCADSWSSYWYNDLVVVNGGLGGRAVCPESGQAGSNRGVDIYRLARDYDARHWRYSNPQTQEEWQGPGGDDDDSDDDSD